MYESSVLFCFFNAFDFKWTPCTDPSPGVSPSATRVFFSRQSRSPPWCQAQRKHGWADTRQRQEGGGCPRGTPAAQGEHGLRAEGFHDSVARFHAKKRSLLKRIVFE